MEQKTPPATTLIISTMKIKTTNNLWLLTGASATGKYHLENGIPCQDAFCYKMISSHWGIAIVCDGAGSQPNSQFGSSLAATVAFEALSDLLIHEKWLTTENVPSDLEWRAVVNQVLFRVFNSLCDFASEHELPVNSLASTIIMSVFSQSCVLSAHVGDGRMAVLTADNEWVAAISPFKGETVGETVFITNLTQQNTCIYLSTSMLAVPVKAVILLTDGLENLAFTCYQPDENDFFHDPNEPFAPFLNALTRSFAALSFEATEFEIADKLTKFLESGHPALSEEADDKTIIISILIDKP